MSNEMPKNIAAELRVRAAIEQIPGTLFDRAADEIERLRDLIEGHDHLAMGQRDQMKRLRWERDEARRKICEIESQCICDPPRSPQKYASLFGWDCFKEATDER